MQNGILLGTKVIGKVYSKSEFFKSKSVEFFHGKSIRNSCTGNSFPVSCIAFSWHRVYIYIYIYTYIYIASYMQKADRL